MHYEAFIEQVQQRTGLDSTEEATQATRATLQTLGERLSKTETEKLAAQLPDPLKAYLLLQPETQRFSLEEFFNRVSAREDVGRPHAIAHARAVFGVLREAVSAGELEDVKRELAPEYAELLGESSSG
jgi:uncharacterized protein (DUF2267 family)